MPGRLTASGDGHTHSDGFCGGRLDFGSRPRRDLGLLGPDVLPEMIPGVIVDEALRHRGLAAGNPLRQAVEPGVVPRHELVSGFSAAVVPTVFQPLAVGPVVILPGGRVAFIAVAGSHEVTPEPVGAE